MSLDATGLPVAIADAADRHAAGSHAADSHAAGLHVAGMGTAVPPHTMSQRQALELAEQIMPAEDGRMRSLRAIYRRAGVENRHTCVPYETGFDWAKMPRVDCDGQMRPRGASTAARMELYEQHAPPLAIAAAEQALADGAVDPQSITHLVTVSCTGFVSPGVDAALISELSLPADTERVNVGFMGCHGAINGLRVASALAAADPRRGVLMVCVELCSLHYFFDSDPEKLVSNALFADGAAAVVGTGSGDGDHSRWRVLATGSCLLPDSTEAMSWRVRDHGFEMTLSAAVPERIATCIRPWLTKWLATYGTSIEEIDHWAIHPGGPRIVSAVAEGLHLDTNATDASKAVLANHGNMSSPTVLFIADRLSEGGARGKAVMLAFGPGLAAEAALIEFR